MHNVPAFIGLPDSSLNLREQLQIRFFHSKGVPTGFPRTECSSVPFPKKSAFPSRRAHCRFRQSIVLSITG